VSGPAGESGRDAVSSGEPQLVLDARAELGEAPTWDVAEQRLIWVDITPGRVHRFDPSTGRMESFEVGEPVGAAVPAASGRLALATDSGFALLDPTTGSIEPVAAVEADRHDTAMNDGKCDRAGRFWAGTRDVEGRRLLGSLYRLDPDHRVVRVVPEVILSNGLAWTADGRAMYYIDSVTYGIDVFDIDPDVGDVSRRRRLVDLPREWGLPDGMTIDAEGFLWVAFWGGGTVRRLAPTGELMSVVGLPVTQVTSCAFGGPDLSDLYVTSARGGLSLADLRDQPSAGGLFLVRPGVRGLPERSFAG
jgi:sugar lactone lactonase YvrE